MTRTTRQRRPAGRGTLLVMRPLMRYSPGRSAYVLRLVGQRWGPVLVPRPTAAVFDLDRDRYGQPR